jgi:hemerythrin superfamily protein
MPIDSIAPQNPRILFEEDHAHLEALLTRVIASANEIGIARARDLWASFERGLLAHMNAEEMYALPLLPIAREAERRHVVAEHTALRGLLGKIGIAFDLHAIPIDTLTALRDLLREHMEAEETLLYAESERRASVAAARLIAQRVCSTTMRAAENGCRHIVRGRTKRRVSREHVR